MAGEEQDLALPGILLQALQSQGHTGVVKVAEGVVQHQWGGLLRREGQLAHRQTHRQIELVHRAPGQADGPPGQHTAGLPGRRLEFTGEGELLIFSAGEGGEELSRPTVERR